MISYSVQPWAVSRRANHNIGAKEAGLPVFLLCGDAKLNLGGCGQIVPIIACKCEVGSECNRLLTSIRLSYRSGTEPLRLEIDVADGENDGIAVLEQHHVSGYFRSSARNLRWCVVDTYLFHFWCVYTKLTKRNLRTTHTGR